MRLRAERIGAVDPSLFLAAETDLAAVLGHVDAVQPDLLVVDSVQTIATAEVDGHRGRRHPGARGRGGADPGGQGPRHRHRARRPRHQGRLDRRAAAARAPRRRRPAFEGDRHSPLRLVRAVKNRYGPADEVGCFELDDDGIVGLADPSGLFLSRRCATVPAPASPSPSRAGVRWSPRCRRWSRRPAGSPRRATSGLDASRVAMVLAVLERRAGVPLAPADVYVATVGGVRLTEPAADLAVALALASAATQQPLPGGLVAIGEVGLAGEVRRVPSVSPPAGRGGPARLHPRPGAARPRPAPTASGSRRSADLDGCSCGAALRLRASAEHSPRRR